MRGWVMLGVAAALAVACEQSLQPAGDAGSDEPDASDATSPFAFGDGAPSPPPDASPPDALPPPTFPCVDAGADASVCPLPPSVCVDSVWLEYFDDGVCVDGGCSFTPKLLECHWLCVKGACYQPPVTQAMGTTPLIGLPR